MKMIRLFAALVILYVGVQGVCADEALDMTIACDGNVIGMSNMFGEATFTFKPNGKAYPSGFFFDALDYTASDVSISLNTPRGCRIPLPPDLKNSSDVCRFIGGVDRGTGAIVIEGFVCSGSTCKMYEYYKGQCKAFKKVF